MEALTSFGALEEFLEILCAQTDSDAAIFHCLDPVDFSYPMTLTHGDLFTRDFLEEYDCGVGAGDPQIRVALDHRLPPGEVYQCHEYFSEDQRKNDPYFSDFLARHNVKWFSGYLASIESSVGVGIGVARRSSRPHYNEKDKATIGALTEFIEDWARIIVALQREKLIARAAVEALKQKPDFAALVDAQGRLLWMDDAAKEIMTGVSRLVLRNGYLTPVGGRYAEQFVATAKDLAKKTYGPPRDEVPSTISMDVTLESGRRLGLTVTPVHAQEGKLADAGMKGSLVLGRERPVVADGSAVGPGDLSVLSGKELEVARHIGDGLTTPEVAAALGVAPSTVHTHLKRSYKKLGIKSKHALAALYIEAMAEKRL